MRNGRRRSRLDDPGARQPDAGVVGELGAMPAMDGAADAGDYAGGVKLPPRVTLPLTHEAPKAAFAEPRPFARSIEVFRTLHLTTGEELSRFSPCNRRPEGA